MGFTISPAKVGAGSHLQVTNAGKLSQSSRCARARSAEGENRARPKTAEAGPWEDGQARREAQDRQARVPRPGERDRVQGDARGHRGRAVVRRRDDDEATTTTPSTWGGTSGGGRPAAARAAEAAPVGARRPEREEPRGTSSATRFSAPGSSRTAAAAPATRSRRQGRPAASTSTLSSPSSRP